MPLLGLYSWSQYTTPAGIPSGDLTGDTTPNDPASPGYNSGAPSWIGKTFTFNGGSPSSIDINDDDANFEDGYVETGGAQTLAQDVTIDGTLYSAGSVVENEFSLIDSTGQEIYVVRINGVNVGFTYASGEEPTTGETFTATQGLDGSPVDNADGASSSSEPYADVICFATGTLIDTPDGPRAVEDLQPADLVTTLDHGPIPIRWVRSSHQPLEAAEKDAKPVLIAAGALGGELPLQDLIVSPQHRILVGGHRQLQALFQTEALAPAKSLTSLRGIRNMQGKTKITWIHFACDRHEVVTANGCLSESLLLGPMVVNGLTAPERQALTDIFGSPPTPDSALNGPPARECLTVGAVRRKLARVSEAQEELVAKELRKWDVDFAMEQYEADLMRDAKAMKKARIESAA